MVLTSCVFAFHHIVRRVVGERLDYLASLTVDFFMVTDVILPFALYLKAEAFCRPDVWCSLYLNG